jgi:hypothetical protein
MSGPFESYDDLEDAAQRLQAADPAERRVAIIALGHSGDPAAVTHLAGIVADPDAGVRQQVAMALGEFDGPESASALVKLLVDPERAVASAAADSMAELKDPACVDAILPLVRHGHAFVRMGALRALKELRRKDTLKPALEALQDGDAAVRVQAIGVIGFLKLEESIPALTASTSDSDAHVRRAAVSALAFSQMKPAAESITRALGDDDWMVREMAAETLGLNANGSVAADQLIAALSIVRCARSGTASPTTMRICAKRPPRRWGRSPIPPLSRIWRWSQTTAIPKCGRTRAGRSSRSPRGKQKHDREKVPPGGPILTRIMLGELEWRRGLLMQLAAGGVAPAIIIERV